MLQETLEDARSVTEAHYDAMGLFGDSPAMDNFTASGLSSEEVGQLWNVAGDIPFFRHPDELSRPVSGADFRVWYLTLTLKRTGIIVIARTADRQRWGRRRSLESRARRTPS